MRLQDVQDRLTWSTEEKILEKGSVKSLGDKPDPDPSVSGKCLDLVRSS